MLSKVIGYVIHEASPTMSEVDILQKDRNVVVFRAILQDFVRNRNMRIYAPELLRRGFSAAHIKELIYAKSWYGELDHPSDDSISRQSKIIRKNSPHIITGYDFYPDRIEATIQTTNYEVGKNFRDEILGGYKAAFSLRALGNVVKTSEGVTVTDPFKIITYDNVLLPSHRNAYEIDGSVEFANRNKFNLNEGSMISLTSDSFRELISLSENVSTLVDSTNILADDMSVSINESEIIVSTKEMKIKALLEKHLVNSNLYRNYLNDMRNA